MSWLRRALWRWQSWLETVDFFEMRIFLERMARVEADEKDRLSSQRTSVVPFALVQASALGDTEPGTLPPAQRLFRTDVGRRGLACCSRSDRVSPSPSGLHFSPHGIRVGWCAFVRTDLLVVGEEWVSFYLCPSFRSARLHSALRNVQRAIRTSPSTVPYRPLPTRPFDPLTLPPFRLLTYTLCASYIFSSAHLPSLPRALSFSHRVRFLPWVVCIALAPARRCPVCEAFVRVCFVFCRAGNPNLSKVAQYAITHMVVYVCVVRAYFWRSSPREGERFCVLLRENCTPCRFFEFGRTESGR